MNLSSLATNALATTRSTFKGLAEAAVASGDETASKTPAKPEQPAKPEPRRLDVKDTGQADATATKPKGVRRGTVLDSYA